VNEKLFQKAGQCGKQSLNLFSFDETFRWPESTFEEKRVMWKVERTELFNYNSFGRFAVNVTGGVRFYTNQNGINCYESPFADCTYEPGVNCLFDEKEFLNLFIGVPYTASGGFMRMITGKETAEKHTFPLKKIFSDERIVPRNTKLCQDIISGDVQ